MSTKRLTELLTQMDAIKTEADAKHGEFQWPAEKLAEWDKLYQEAEGIRTQMDRADKFNAAKAWASQSDGQSAVKASFNASDNVWQGGGRPAMPGEGSIAGVSIDRQGEMYATSEAGEHTVTALKSGAYKDAFNAYIRSRGNTDALAAKKIKGESAMKILQEGSDPQGGFWIPPQFFPELIKKTMTITAIRRNAYTFTTGSDIASFPSVVYKPGGVAGDQYTWGGRISWTAEAPSSDVSETTNPVAGRVMIPVHLATLALKVTRQQLEDTPFDLLGYLSDLIAESYAVGEENVFLNGTGSGQPEGLLSNVWATTASGTNNGMAVSSGDANLIMWGIALGSATGTAALTKGLTGVEAALPPQYEAGAKWYASKATYAAIRALTDVSGRPLWSPVEAWPTMANGMSPTLLGYPIEKSQFMPAIAANAYPMIFGDMKGYFIADRVGLSVEIFREVAALSDEVVIYCRKRVGGQLVKPFMMKTHKVAA